MSSSKDALAAGASSDLERAAPMFETEQAVFEEERASAVRRLQHFLHGFPTAIPFIVLLLGLVLFSAVSARASSTRSTSRWCSSR